MNDFKKDFDDIMGDFVDKCDSVTYVCFVMDHSGSMGSNKEQSMSNFNEYLNTLKKQSDDKMQTIVNIVEFDSNINISVNNQLIENVKELKDYWIGGLTALYDAIGCGISEIQRLLDKDPRENKAALMLIQTDGWNNASEEWSQEQIQKKIKELEDTKMWTFTFLAEGIDASAVEGLSQYKNIMVFAKTDAGYKTSAINTTQGLTNFYDSRKSGLRSVTNFYNTSDGSGGEENK